MQTHRTTHLKTPQRLLIVATLFAGILTCSSNAASGSLKTTDAQSVQNQNQYASADAVLLNGDGFDPGTYYYRVVSPEGALLYTDGYRSLVIGASGSFTNLALAPFLPTTNVDGVYKVEVSSGTAFTNSTTKTDNFKIAPALQASIPPPSYTVSGKVFFDVDADGALDGVDIGLPASTVALSVGGAVVAGPVATDGQGCYTIAGVLAGSYTLEVSSNIAALVRTTSDPATVEVSADTSGNDVGFAIEFGSLNGMSANGFTIGYWKNNIEKHLASTAEYPKGTQIGKMALNNYNATVGALQYDTVFGAISLTQSKDVLSATTSSAVALLKKQLLASEYNYASGAFLTGGQMLTYLFIYQGEVAVDGAAGYTDAYLRWLKDCFDAYNNSHGTPIVSIAVAPCRNLLVTA